MTPGTADRGAGQRPVRRVCELCGAPLPVGPATGRPRAFCGEVCRQTAHRRRLCAPPAAPRPAAPTGFAAERRFVPPLREPSEESVAELARSVREHAHDLVRRLPSADDEEALRRVAKLREQLDGLTAAVIGRACGDRQPRRELREPRP
ncbi:hypothetical protein ACFY9H_28530 [Streptomyces bacillaris]|uniref:Uncharacterized protein n=1 Tax=Streptomyces cavourensis TaxID=67258 RepID=A0AAD0VFN0_9ACTN|nr:MULTISPECIES: hypothetical protein [Streptomyces]NUW24034.1 hypothetical protein [Streptomyces roseoviolaceus]AXI73057.1 hypothetical protein DTW94_18670 [Streptomyces cavourensis]NUV42905.1 hypothetical protein [Streptomyces sp. CAI-24]NUV84398.1 hypothetical protein [Streptomyces sp. CAI-155]NUV90020.1 hypothetical protein [Streptomyces sp. KAI-26]